MKQNNLSATTIKKANTFLTGFNNYFKEIPINQIFKTLRDLNIIVLQEDQTVWQGCLCGEKGRGIFDIGNILWKTNENNIEFYEKYDNVNLILTWYKMISGNYEIVCYIS
jgi:hypothetical protein